MNSAFNIATSVTDTTECSLFIEIGSYGISYWALKADNECFALSIYHFKENASPHTVAGYLKDIVADQDLLQQKFKKINIIYAFPECLLVPGSFMVSANEDKMLNLVYGEESDSETKTDFINQLNLHSIYRIPKQGIELIAQVLSSPVKQYHLYTLLAAAANNGANQLYCIFGTAHFIVKLIKNGSLQIIQQFIYKTPEDVAYYLLSICSQFEVPLPETAVMLHGMIDEDSRLYDELKKYLPILQFAGLPTSFTYDGMEKYPPHYFSHLFEIAACV